ncbi:MAG: peptidoglycan DD-metalloendopeptidase family protein [Micrococcales bacterium]|nr:peptidoglycan DD-metalloendopeptidase family protein [Micrococcales bacterium]
MSDTRSTSPLTWVLAGLALLPLLVPFGAALLVAAVAVPAATPTRCDTAASAAGGWQVPFAQRFVRTSSFGMRLHPIEHVWRLHSGVDLVSLPGPGPVLAAHAGRVIVAGPRPGIGLSVDLDHGDGTTSRYAHLATLDPDIRAGAAVSAGQRLGVEGSSGTSTGNHLHFEIRTGGHPVDPVAFMAAHGAPLDGRPAPEHAGADDTIADTAAQRRVALPAPSGQRMQSLTAPAAPISPRVKALYVAAGERYHLPWSLLAGVGMEETRHGAATATSSAGAWGLMQFLPTTWDLYGVDGDRDGRADITSDADSIHSAANYLARSGATTGPDGIARALFAYNHADWYVADVLYYAHTYDNDPGLAPGTCPPRPERAAGGTP